MTYIPVLTITRGILSLTAILAGVYTFDRGLNAVLEAPTTDHPSTLSIFGMAVSSESVGVVVIAMTVPWIWAAVKLSPKRLIDKRDGIHVNQ